MRSNRPHRWRKVQRGQLPTELGLWRGYYERMWMRASPLAIHRLPDLYGGLYLLIERQAPDGTIARCRLKTFGSRNRIGFVPACDGMGGLSVMLPLAVAASALGVPAEALNDRMVPLGDLWGPAGRLLEERLAICRDDGDRMAILNRVLRGLLARGAADRRVFAAVRAIEGCSGTLRINALAESLGLGWRSLERLFASTFGISPKRYARGAPAAGDRAADRDASTRGGLDGPRPRCRVLLVFFEYAVTYMSDFS